MLHNAQDYITKLDWLTMSKNGLFPCCNTLGQVEVGDRQTSRSLATEGGLSLPCLAAVRMDYSGILIWIVSYITAIKLSLCADH